MVEHPPRLERPAAEWPSAAEKASDEGGGGGRYDNDFALCMTCVTRTEAESSLVRPAWQGIHGVNVGFDP